MQNNYLSLFVPFQSVTTSTNVFNFLRSTQSEIKVLSNTETISFEMENNQSAVRFDIMDSPFEIFIGKVSPIGIQ